MKKFDRLPVSVFFAVVFGLAAEIRAGGYWSIQSPVAGAVQAIATDGGSSVYVFADFLYRTEDQGASWQAAPGVIPDSVSRLVVGRESIFALGQSGVYRSRDSGTSWERVLDFSASSYPVDLQFSPADPGQLYALSDLALLRSADDGETWSSVGPTFPRKLASLFSGVLLDTRSPSVLYVSDYWQGILKSSDSGATWAAADDGLPSIEEYSTSLLAIDPGDPHTLYALSSRPRGCPSASVQPTGLSDAQLPSYLYKSTDAAASWSPINPPAEFSLILIDPANPLHIFLAAPGLCFFAAGDVFETFDGGQTWSPVDRGLDGAKISQMVIAESAKALYAASNHGVLRLDLRGRDVNFAPVVPNPPAPIRIRAQ